MEIIVFTNITKVIIDPKASLGQHQIKQHTEILKDKKKQKKWTEIAFEQWLKIAELDRWDEPTPTKVIWKRPTTIHMEIKSQ